MSYRLGETFSLERDPRSLKHTTPRLDEDSNVTHTGLMATSLGRAILAWARERVAQHSIWSPKRDARTKARTSFCNFRLGERDSFGRNLQSFSLVQTPNTTKTILKHHIIRTKQTYNHHQPKWTCYNHIWTTNLRTHPWTIIL